MTTRTAGPRSTSHAVIPFARDVAASVAALAARFRPYEAVGVRARWRLDITGHEPHTIEVHRGRCVVTRGAVGSHDTTISVDAATWLDIVAGRETGVDAFLAGRLTARGDLNRAIQLETMFQPGPNATKMLRTRRTDVGSFEIESLVTGRGEPVLLLHGLAANKVSFLPTLVGLSDEFEVHALDLPGFGASGKPLPRGHRYTAGWMAAMVRRYLNRNDIASAYLVGNSMGGRIAAETALRFPHRVRGTVGLCSAVAFDEWQWLAPFLALMRGQWLAALPFRIRRQWVYRAIGDMFGDTDSVAGRGIDAAVDDFLRMTRDPRYRLAVLACARNLATERASGPRSFWTRLGANEVPSYWVWGERDRLVSHRYADRVKEALPQAKVEVWSGVGHVPQFEAPRRTNEAIARFIRSVEADRS